MSLVCWEKQKPGGLSTPPGTGALAALYALLVNTISVLHTIDYIHWLMRFNPKLGRRDTSQDFAQWVGLAKI